LTKHDLLLVVAFSGSGNTIRNWVTDFTSIQVPYNLPGCVSCWIHSGFDLGWSEHRAAILDAIIQALATHLNFSLIITGHSIRAGVATLAGAELSSMNFSADAYAFSSPRVRNDIFTKFVTALSPQLGKNYRMTHENDPVPQLPPAWIGYQHTSPEYWFATGANTTNLYVTDEILVCEGIENEECNAGMGLVPIDGTAHNHYLGNISACQRPVAF
jgi:hypothetical protein